MRASLGEKKLHYGQEEESQGRIIKQIKKISKGDQICNRRR
jgi:hypothetical protein